MESCDIFPQNLFVLFQAMKTVLSCQFVKESDTDFYAYKIPAFILLLANTVFLLWIMLVQKFFNTKKIRVLIISDCCIKATLPNCNGFWPAPLPSCKGPSGHHPCARVYLHTYLVRAKCYRHSNCLHYFPSSEGSISIHAWGSHHLTLLLPQHRGAEHPHHPLEEMENDQNHGVRVSVQEVFSCCS